MPNETDRMKEAKKNWAEIKRLIERCKSSEDEEYVRPIEQWQDTDTACDEASLAASKA